MSNTSAIHPDPAPQQVLLFERVVALEGGLAALSLRLASVEGRMPPPMGKVRRTSPAPALPSPQPLPLWGAGKASAALAPALALPPAPVPQERPQGVRLSTGGQHQEGAALALPGLPACPSLVPAPAFLSRVGIHWCAPGWIPILARVEAVQGVCP